MKKLNEVQYLKTKIDNKLLDKKRKPSNESYLHSD